MKILLSKLFKREQSAHYNDSDWHLDIVKDDIEDDFLSSKFPREMDITTWLDSSASKIDRDYCDVSWHTKEISSSGKPGLFIAFLERKKYREFFLSIGKPPEKYCNAKIRVTLIKHDQPDDRKSHPEFKCWIEIIGAEFQTWVQDDW